MIYITGDTHGPTPIGMHSVDGFGKRLNKENFPEQKEMTRDDYVIICGDFGGIWNYGSRYDRAGSSFREKICLDHGESKEEKYWLDWLSEKPFTVLFCDGNHENHDRLSGAYPEEDFCRGKSPQDQGQRFPPDEGICIRPAGILLLCLRRRKEPRYLRRDPEAL